MCKKKHLFLLFAIISFAYCNIAYSQQRLKYWKDSEVLLQDQASLIYDKSNSILTKYPPSTEAGDERKLALFSLDALLHDVRLDNGVAFNSYLSKITNDISLRLGEKDLTSGYRIHQFYNHGYIIETNYFNIAVDLALPKSETDLVVEDEILKALVDKCEILFISHKHGDHADYRIVKMFHDQGKEVVIPENPWPDSDLKLTLSREETLHQKTFKVVNHSLLVQIYPGYQGDVMNNVYIFQIPGNIKVMHTGDQDFDKELVSTLKDEKIDILLTQCWLMPIEEFVHGINPSLVIAGHHNEVSHTIDHRESYWLTFRRFANLNTPYIVMSWGESIELR